MEQYLLTRLPKDVPCYPIRNFLKGSFIEENNDLPLYRKGRWADKTLCSLGESLLCISEDDRRGLSLFACGELINAFTSEDTVDSLRMADMAGDVITRAPAVSDLAEVVEVEDDGGELDDGGEGGEVREQTTWQRGDTVRPYQFVPCDQLLEDLAQARSKIDALSVDVSTSAFAS